MKIDLDQLKIDLHVHLEDKTSGPKLDAILSGVQQVLHLQQESLIQGAKMIQEIDDLTVAVEEQTGVVQSSIVLITGLHDMLSQILALGDPAQIKQALTGLRDKVAANKQALADAVAANPLPTP